MDDQVTGNKGLSCILYPAGPNKVSSCSLASTRRALHEFRVAVDAVWIRKEPYQDIAQIQDGTRPGTSPLTWRCICALGHNWGGGGLIDVSGLGPLIYS